jgi:plastocyanin
MEDFMRAFNVSLVSAIFCASLLAPSVRADEDKDDKDKDAPQSVTVSFGAGLNTAQLPPNPANHHILPPEIRVKVGGVVNFVVAGFHQPMVYLPGTVKEQIVVPPAPALFIDDNNNLFYRGISPVDAPPAGVSNAQNRVESVSFPQSGRYLVLCNVRPHFLDGMFAYVVVKD